MRTKLTYKNHRLEVRRAVADNGSVQKSIWIDGVFQTVYTWPVMKPLGAMAAAKSIVDSWPAGQSPIQLPPPTVVSVKFG